MAELLWIYILAPLVIAAIVVFIAGGIIGHLIVIAIAALAYLLYVLARQETQRRQLEQYRQWEAAERNRARIWKEENEK